MTAPAGSGQAVQRARRGVYVAFGASGVLLSTWASGIPQVRDELDLTPAALGLVLLAIAVGSLLALPSAGLAAVALFATFIQDLANEGVTANFLLSDPKVMAGLFIGAMTPFVFASFAMNAVGEAGGKVVEEVRRQFREIPGIMEGKAKPE